MELVFSGLRQDLRFTGRLIRKQPGFFVAVAIGLALGIGANAGVFMVAIIDELLAANAFPSAFSPGSHK